MKCIKEKCEYYMEHDFRLSFSVCELDGRTFKKESDINCFAENYIKYLENQKEIVQKQVDFIKNNQ